MMCCDGQKAECYQGRGCRFANGGEVVKDGMSIELYENPDQWLFDLIDQSITWLKAIVLIVFLGCVTGFVYAKFFS